MNQMPSNVAAARVYQTGRLSLLTFMILSALNMLGMAFADFYFPYSSFFSIYEFSGGYLGWQETGDVSYLIVGIAVGIAILVPFLFCWIFSKKKYGWIVAGTVFVCLDTAGVLFYMIVYQDFSFIIDALFHAWICYSMIAACVKGKKLFANNADGCGFPQCGDSAQDPGMFVQSGEYSAPADFTLDGETIPSDRPDDNDA